MGHPRPPRRVGVVGFHDERATRGHREVHNLVPWVPLPHISAGRMPWEYTSRRPNTVGLPRLYATREIPLRQGKGCGQVFFCTGTVFFFLWAFTRVSLSCHGRWRFLPAWVYVHGCVCPRRADRCWGDGSHNAANRTLAAKSPGRDMIPDRTWATAVPGREPSTEDPHRSFPAHCSLLGVGSRKAR